MDSYSLGTQRFPFMVTPGVLPGNLIFAKKIEPPNLESQNQAKNIPVVIPSSPIKIWGK